MADAAAPDRVTDGLRALLAAVTFLTRVPVGRSVRLDGHDVCRGALLFPIVGAALGTAQGGVALGLDGPLGPLAAATVAVALDTLLTGAFHLDALADVSDATGTRTREAALRAMRDPTIGAFGASALAIDIVLRVTLIAQLLPHADAVLVLMAAGCLARASFLIPAASMPYVREGEGTGKSVVGGLRLPQALAGVGIGIAATIALGPVRAAAMVGATIIVAALVSVWARRRLRGVTGDVLGATAEATQTLALLAAVAAT